MRGIDGVPADADRHEGFTEALKKYPDIKVVASVFTGWSQDKAAQEMKDLIGSGKQIDGVWTSGIDKAVVDAYKSANLKYVPVVGADNNGFMGEEIELKDAGLVGINVTNPPAVGGAGLAVALDVLAGQRAAARHSSHAGGLRQYDARRHGVAEVPLRPEGRSEQPRVQPRQALYALHHRAGEGLQGPGRMSADDHGDVRGLLRTP